MKIIDAFNVYTYVLNELEWYAVDDAARNATVRNCLAGAQTAECKYAAIIVEPDACMSLSPEPNRHKVWGHTFETDAHEVLRNMLLDAKEIAREALSDKQITAIVHQVFGL